MTRKLFAMLLLSLTVAACDSASTDTNSNANIAPKTNTNSQASPAPAQVSTPEPGTSAQAQLKAGDKVRVATNGSFAEGTVVSVDEKSGKVTVRLQGESKDRLVSISEVTRQ